MKKNENRVQIQPFMNSSLPHAWDLTQVQFLPPKSIL
jgi:hypothetical protein